jgi:hypothetical protein
MAVRTYDTHPANELTKSFEGNTYSRGGTVTPDTYYGETATAIWVGNDGSADGDLQLEGVDGETIIFKFVPSGTLIRFKHTRVVSTSTTATNMTWVGGED